MNINKAQSRPQIFNSSLPEGNDINSNPSKKQKVGQEVPIPSSQEQSLTQPPLSTFISGFFGVGSSTCDPSTLGSPVYKPKAQRDSQPTGTTSSLMRGFFEQPGFSASSVSDPSREILNEESSFDFSFRDHSSTCTDKVSTSSFPLVKKQESRKRKLEEVDLLCTESLVADSPGSGFSFSSSQYYSQASSARTAVDSSDPIASRSLFHRKLDSLNQPKIETRRTPEGVLVIKKIDQEQSKLALKAAFNFFKKSIGMNN